MKFIITGGNIHDCKQTESLLSSVIRRGVKVLADKAYDADKIIKYITNQSGVVVIPARNNRTLKREYDKLSTSFLSLIQLAATLIIIPKFSPIV